MEERYICYCGLYCGNCSVKVKVLPAAELLRDEMKKAGFDDVMQNIPGGGDFWKFLNGMTDSGICTSCYEGGGNPGCKVRICAREKGIKVCALCESYPCEHFGEMFFTVCPTLRQDNELLRNEGMEAWAKLQDERHAKGYTYADE